MTSNTRTLDTTQLTTTPRPRPTRPSPSLSPSTTKPTTKPHSRPLTASTIALIVLGIVILLAIILLLLYFCIYRRGKKPALTSEARAAQLELLGRRERVPGGGYEIPALWVEPPRPAKPAEPEYVDAVGGYFAPGRNGNPMMR